MSTTKEDLILEIRAEMDQLRAALLTAAGDMRELGDQAKGRLGGAFREVGEHSNNLFGRLKDLRMEARQHERTFNFVGEKLSAVGGIAKGTASELAGVGIALASGMWTTAAIEALKLVIGLFGEHSKEAEKAAAAARKWREETEKAISAVEDRALEAQKKRSGWSDLEIKQSLEMKDLLQRRADLEDAIREAEERKKGADDLSKRREAEEGTTKAVEEYNKEIEKGNKNPYISSYLGLTRLVPILAAASAEVDRLAKAHQREQEVSGASAGSKYEETKAEILARGYKGREKVIHEGEARLARLQKEYDSGNLRVSADQYSDLLELERQAAQRELDVFDTTESERKRKQELSWMQRLGTMVKGMRQIVQQTIKHAADTQKAEAEGAIAVANEQLKVDEEALTAKARRHEISASQETQQLIELENRRYLIVQQELDREVAREGITEAQKAQASARKEVEQKRHQLELGRINDKAAADSIADTERLLSPIADAMSSNLAAMVGGTKSATQAMNDCWRSMVDQILQQLTRLAVNFIFTTLLKVGATVSGIPAAGAVGAPFMAKGGPVTGGSPYLVGENGPEAFVPDGNGRIAPNDMLGGPSTIIHWNQTIHAIDGPSVARLFTDHGSEMVKGLNRLIRNGRIS